MDVDFEIENNDVVAPERGKRVVTFTKQDEIDARQGAYGVLLALPDVRNWSVEFRGWIGCYRCEIQNTQGVWFKSHDAASDDEAIFAAIDQLKRVRIR